jgi:hypothetical protein
MTDSTQQTFKNFCQFSELLEIFHKILIKLMIT